MSKRYVFFDLDNTLLSGDSDVLWCDFLISRRIIDAQIFGLRNSEMEERYKSGLVGLDEFANFYVGTLADRTVEFWEPVRQDFFSSIVQPRICQEAQALVRGHRLEGDRLVMTTATNRFITELTARHFGIEDLIATEPQVAAGRFTGSTIGILNMRKGKVERLKHWLSLRNETLESIDSTAYSDSINDLPLLEAVNCPVAVDPDPALRKIADQRGWRVMKLSRDQGPLNL
jgi:HAD superfamily hydrolase (TIGR01490 family)